MVDRGVGGEASGEGLRGIEPGWDGAGAMMLLLVLMLLMLLLVGLWLALVCSPFGGSVVVGSPLLPPRLPLVGSGLSGPAPTGACRRSDRRLLSLLVRPRSGPA